VDKIIQDLKAKLMNNDNVDFITISGSGEPTLNPQLGDIAKKIRSISNLPLVLITNSSLLTYDSVLESAKKFDIIMPSLDAGDNRTFKMINRPAKGFDIDKIAEGIKRLKHESKSEVWLEVMLTKGKITNTSSRSIVNITDKISEIHPDLVFLNSPSRPPQETFVKSLTKNEMKRIRYRMLTNITEGVEIQAVPKLSFTKSQILDREVILKEIPRLLSVRPCTLRAISNLTGVNLSEAGKYMEHMLDTGRVVKIVSGNETYYQSLVEGTD
jgi:wyosine [tRNA(Phe)-imidazoG37] synthetase (radical SAM superfamily)